MIAGQGRYGSVWQGSMGDQDVAVKIYPSHYRNYFQNERDTYCLPFMEHPSLLSYYGISIFFIELKMNYTESNNMKLFSFLIFKCLIK